MACDEDRVAAWALVPTVQARIAAAAMSELRRVLFMVFVFVFVVCLSGSGSLSCAVLSTLETVLNDALKESFVHRVDDLSRVVTVFVDNTFVFEVHCGEDVNSLVEEVFVFLSLDCSFSDLKGEEVVEFLKVSHGCLSFVYFINIPYFGLQWFVPCDTL